MAQRNVLLADMQPQIAGIDLDPIDISTAVHDAISGVLSKYLTTAFISANGECCLLLATTS